MMTPVFSVIADVGQRPASVFNTRQVEPSLWVKIPELVAHLAVYEINDVYGNSISWIRNDQESWLTIDSNLLDLHAGMHEYQIKLVDTVTDWTSQIYFSYIIQTDDPDKPYYYMGPAREEY